MRVAVFGATGRTGRELLRELRQRGHTARAVCRKAGVLRAEPPDLEVGEVDHERGEELAGALAGCDAVLCAFGPTRPPGPPFLAALTRRIIEAMRQLGVRRLECITGALVGEYACRSVPFQLMAREVRRRYPELARDGAEQERLVEESGLEWTLVKPPRLTMGRPRGHVRAGEQEPVGVLSRISRADLASFMVEQLTQPAFVRKRVVVRA